MSSSSAKSILMLGIADEDLCVFKSLISSKVKALQNIEKEMSFLTEKNDILHFHYEDRRRSLRAMSLLTEAELQVESDRSVRPLLNSERVLESKSLSLKILLVSSESE